MSIERLSGDAMVDLDRHPAPAKTGSAYGPATPPRPARRIGILALPIDECAFAKLRAAALEAALANEENLKNIEPGRVSRSSVGGSVVCRRPRLGSSERSHYENEPTS